MTLRDSRGMNYDSKLQNMSWFCYNMWTRCPRQAWPHSLTRKHYRALVGNHHRGYQSPYIRHALKKELLLLEQINRWLGVLRTHMEWRLQVSRPQNTSHVCMTDLGWFQRKTTLTFSNPRRQLASNAPELEEVTSYIRTYASWANMKKCFQKFPTLA